MNERSYWDQFLKTGRVEDYLQYRNQIQERNALRNRAKLHESSSFTSSFRAKAQGQDGEQHAGSDQSARDRSEGRTDRLYQRKGLYGDQTSRLCDLGADPEAARREI